MAEQTNNSAREIKTLPSCLFCFVFPEQRYRVLHYADRVGEIPLEVGFLGEHPRLESEPVDQRVLPGRCSR